MVAGVQVPVIPLVAVVGNAGAVAFWHKDPIALNVGTTCVVISTSNVDTAAHWPAAGVNVYVFVPGRVVLMVAGVHVPVMPFVEVAGNAGAVEFWHSGPMPANVAVRRALTTTAMVTGVPHSSAAGVNVYVVVPGVAVLIVAGLQVPLIPLVDVAGNTGAAAFWHNGPICVNTGPLWSVTWMFMVTGSPHCPAAGVNV